ncbi:MAG: transporter substrate-binding domain-containing protein [Desulfobacterales bacterium]|nr:transporter substrate-binding domain-containing protein [Desulfobacterales bacterium]
MNFNKGNMYIKRLFFILVFLGITSLVSGVEKIVTVATLDEYSPYCFFKKNYQQDTKAIPPSSDSLELQGYSWDILRESLHEMGYTIELEVCPWARAMNLTEEGKVDILFPTGKNKEREKIFYYSQEPVNEANFLVYIRADYPIHWNGLESLNGLIIGEMRGWNYGDKWKANELIKKHEIGKIMQGFNMLNLKRIDGFAGYEVNFDYALQQSKMKSLFKKLPAFDSTAEYVVGLKNEHVLQILKDFDIGKKKIIQNGKFDQIVKKWQ